MPTTVGTDPLRVWVFDRSTLKGTSFERRWTVHVGNDPTVDGTSAAGPARGPTSSTTGKTTYTGATVASIANTVNGMNHKTFIRPYCPTTFKVVKVNWRRGTGTRDLEDPYGIVATLGSSMSGDDVSVIPYASAYRLEVIPTSTNLTERFLVALEVAPSSTATESTKAAVTATNFMASQQGDAVAAFAITDGATSGTVVMATAGTFRLLLAGLATSAARTFAKGSNITSITKVADGDTDLTYTSSSVGTLELSVVVSGAGTGANNTVTVS
jgi:hypothetical protein